MAAILLALVDLTVLSSSAPCLCERFRDGVNYTCAFWNRASVQADNSTLYLFGDNLEDHGQDYQGSGQAVIRGLPNAAGISTCDQGGCMTYSGLNYWTFRREIEEALSRRSKFKTIVVPVVLGKHEPFAGQCIANLGTGIAALDSERPDMFVMLQTELCDFGLCPNGTMPTLAPTKPPSLSPTLVPTRSAPPTRSPTKHVTIPIPQ